jgi:hypothetical protein
MNHQQFSKSLHLNIIYLTFYLFFDSKLSTLHYRLLNILNGFGHSKSNHGSEGHLESILFFEKVDPTEDVMKLKGKLLLTGYIERREKHLTKCHFFDIIHKNKQIIEIFDVLRCIIQQVLHIKNP